MNTDDDPDRKYFLLTQLNTEKHPFYRMFCKANL